MRNDFTDITLVVDRSGSMDSCKLEAQMGINSFIEDQKKKPGEAVFSLLQFDTVHEYVCSGENIKNIDKYILEPRGMTALLDAIGKAIVETGERLSKMNEEDRPGLVVIAIITDGQENSSHEYTRGQIKRMIERQTNEYQWQFTFLGANQDAFTEGSSLGISVDSIANYNTNASVNTYMGLSANVTRMRSAVKNGDSVNCCYTNDERKSMN